jgi:hypothetical protein
MTKQLEQEPKTLEFYLGQTLAKLNALEGRKLTGEEQERYARLQKNADVIRRGIGLREERSGRPPNVESRTADTLPEEDYPTLRTLRLLSLRRGGGSGEIGHRPARSQQKNPRLRHSPAATGAKRRSP